MKQVTHIHKVKEIVNAGAIGHQEIQDILGLSRNQVQHALDFLTRDGLVKRLPAINKRRQYIGVAL